MKDINNGYTSNDANKELSLAVTSFMFNTLITTPLTTATEIMLNIENKTTVNNDFFKFFLNLIK